MISPIPCIIDTDPGVDDVIALLLALSSPHLLVLGITLTHGNCTLSSTEKNLAKLFYALENHIKTTQGSTAEQERWRGVTDRKWRKKWGGEDAETIRVWRGCEGPLQGEAVTAKYFHGQDGLANCETLHPELTPPAAHKSPYYTLCPESALEGVTALVNSRQASTLAYIALGPMTSLAQLSEQLDLESAFSTILSMGGAVDHPGNTTPVAEFNYYADPWSARTIFNLSLSNLYIFPLDLTSYLTLPFSLYASSIDSDFHSPPSASTSTSTVPEDRDPLVHFTSAFLRGTEEVMASFGGDAMELHDPTVVFALIEYVRQRNGQSEDRSRAEDKEGEFAKGWNWKRVDFEIECDGTLTRGMLVLDHRPSSKTSTSITARTGQANRAMAIEQEEAVANGHSSVVDIAEAEARRAEKKRKLEQTKVSGARVVVTSSGSELMRKEMMERIWGVTV
ncbi:hypothetical protein JCM5350_000737 [Sporobolomyces pararoseus]